MIKFRDTRHRDQFIVLIKRMGNQDCYHQSIAYLMSLADMVPEDVYDFDLHHIKHDGIFAAWQTSSSRRATRLMYNLWNGWAYDEDNPDKRIPSIDYAVDNIFCNYEFAPYFYEAIRIRFKWVEY